MLVWSIKQSITTVLAVPIIVSQALRGFGIHEPFLDVHENCQTEESNENYNTNDTILLREGECSGKMKLWIPPLSEADFQSYDRL